jgi:hypothetical protein
MVSIFSDIASSIHGVGKSYDHHHQVEPHVPAYDAALPDISEVGDALQSDSCASKYFMFL